MSTEQKRAMISWAYPGDKWLNRVVRMSDSQVHTVYMRLLDSGKLNQVPEHWKQRQP